nr:RagB/SusD family nutrient uptake outer membrane protein [Bacteroides acidifaciens]
MKIHNYIISAVFVLSSFLSSCSDWLEVEPLNTRSINYFYTTPSEMEQALMGVYNGLLPMSEYYWFMSELRSDNAWCGGGSSVQRDYIEISIFNKNIYQLSTLNDAWLDLYEIVSRANIFLSKVDGVEITVEGVKEQQIAEARFLRAFAYFDLVRYWGRVPLSLTPLTINEAMKLGQSEALEVYEKAIIPDLEYAIAHLTDAPVDYLGKPAAAGRVTLQAAQAMLGRVYLTMAGYPLYDKAKEELAKGLFEEVIDYADAKKKFWAKDAEEWKKIWISDNDNKYHIFEIQYVAAANYGNPMVYWTSPSVSTDYISISMSGNGSVCAGPLDLFFKEEKNEKGEYLDVRCLATIDTIKVFPNGKKYSGEDFFVKFFEHKIKRAKLGYGDIDGQIVDRGYFPINFPLIRLEDVMLMYAEIVGPTERGIEMVNRIRKRATGKELTEEEKEPVAFQQCVGDERRKEFAGEGIRWHDLVRHHDMQPIKDKFYYYAERYGSDPQILSYADRVKEGTHVYPIPDPQMKVSEGLYQQNEAYR